VRVLSIPRDLWDPQQNRALIADYLDGPQALIDRVTGLLGVPVDHYVGLDFAGFAELVDEAGGLHVGIDQPLRDDATGLDLEPTPCTTLDGATTLALVRSRSIGAPPGDLGRIALDQAIMKIAVASLADTGTDLLAIDSYTRVLADHAVLDSGLSLARLTTLGRALARAGSDGTSAETLPVEETVAPDGGTVLRLNSAAPAVLQSFGATGSNPSAPPPPPSSAPADTGPIHSC
jgi:LCP family protein required for cell wall assembly